MAKIDASLDSYRPAHEKAQPEILQLIWIFETFMEIVGFIFAILYLALF